MNNKYLLAALAFPFAFAACTEDTIVSVTQDTDQTTLLENGMIKLGKNFVVGAGESASTRAAFISGSGTGMYWIPVAEDNTPLRSFANGVDGYTRDAIGLCFVNGDEILTNYKFEHDGWVEAGGEMQTLPFQCIDGVRYYDRNYLRFDQLIDANADVNAGITNGVITGTLSPKVDSRIDAFDKEHNIEKLNLGRGLFKTNEKTIFAGDYIVYYPWSNGMLKADKLTLESPTKMFYEGGDYADRIAALNKYMTYTGWLGKLDGGTEAAEMALDRVSELLSMTIDGMTNDADKIILLDTKSSFISKFKLTPNEVKDKKREGEVVETSQTIMIEYGEKIHQCPDHNKGVHTAVYVPMFATTIPAGTYVLAVDSEDGSAVSYKVTKDTKVASAEGKLATALEKVTLSSFAYDVVTNEEELLAANASASKKPILLLGDIELDETVTLTKDIHGFIDGVEVGSLTMPGAPEPYTVTSLKNKINTNVYVNAPGCCQAEAGTLELAGVELFAERTILNQNAVVFTETYNNYIKGTINNEPFVEKDIENLKYKAVAPTMTVQKTATVYVSGAIFNKDADHLKVNNINNKDERFQSLITVESDVVKGADRNDGEISVIENGQLINDAWINNFGTMSNATANTSNIQNREGATYVLKIGGQLTGRLLENDANRRCDFIAEVDNGTDSRWMTAWEQGLANIIEIVKEQNPEYCNANGKCGADFVYSFKLTNNEGQEFVVNNKNVMVVVKNPNVRFVGEKWIPSYIDGEKDLVQDNVISATIGRLVIDCGEQNETDLNYWSSSLEYATGGAPYYYSPVQLRVESAAWAGNECAAGAAENAINVKSGTFRQNYYDLTQSSKNLRLSVVGDFDVTGKFIEESYLSQTGTLTAAAGGRIEFASNTSGLGSGYVSRFYITGSLASADAKTSDIYGIKIAEKVNGTVTENINIAGKSYMEVNGDAVIRVTGNVNNTGTMKWISRTGTKSPGIVYCAGFTTPSNNNYINGTPTIQ